MLFIGYIDIYQRRLDIRKGYDIGDRVCYFGRWEASMEQAYQCYQI